MLPALSLMRGEAEIAFLLAKERTMNTSTNRDRSRGSFFYLGLAAIAALSVSACAMPNPLQDFRVKQDVTAGTPPPAVKSNPGAVLSGKDVDETNTGVPSGRTLAIVASSITVTESWIANSNGCSRILQDKSFLSGAKLIVAVDGFTVQYCKFFGLGGISLDPNDGKTSPGKNVSILDCELDGNNENLNGAMAVYGSNLTLKRVNIHRWPRGMWVGDGDVWVEQCYMHDLTVDDSGAHLENIYVAGGANQTYLSNKLISNGVRVAGSGLMPISASLAIYNESFRTNPPFPSLADIRIEGNYFGSDAYYPLYCGALSGKAGAFPTGMVVRGNVFGRDIQRYSGMGAPAVAFDASQPGNLWENNTWGAMGPFSLAGDPAEGALIAAPKIM